MNRRISLNRRVQQADEVYARRIRERCRMEGILLVNLIGSPGAGKTTLLEATLSRISCRCGVVEGDVATSRDAERIAACGVPAVQINTEGGCHLEAHLVHRGMEALPLEELDLVFVENVGNLVCPAEFDLGEDFKVAVSSVPEGADKPLKYPALFSQAACVVLTKTDLLPHLPFQEPLFWGDVESLNPRAARFRVDGLRREGIDEWCSFLLEAREAKRCGG